MFRATSATDALQYLLRTRPGGRSYDFGPLNREGGERRLNGHYPRPEAHRRIFNLAHDQIDLGRTRAGGVAHLKTYLDYARRGVVAVMPASHRGEERQVSFEDEVKKAIEAKGWQVHTQVGCSGYRIDLAVVDPDVRTLLAAAVECDGSTYHSSRCARERDLLRQAVLEGLVGASIVFGPRTGGLHRKGNQ